MKCLEAKNLDISYGKKQIVFGFNFKLEECQIGCFLGPSGCGKTTVLRSIAGFEQPSKGEIILNGKKLNGFKTYITPEKRNIGMVFQDISLFPHLSVEDNIQFGMRSWSREKRKNRSQELLELIGMSRFGKKYPHQLSGGQQQRIALARAMAPKPSLLLMDEPFSSLDAELREQLAREIRLILKQENISGLLVTHDQNEAMTFADNIIVMSEGEVVQTGSPKELFERPNTTFVGYFIGSPAMNLFESEPSSNDSVKINNTLIKTNTNLSKLKTKNIKLGIRSEFIKIAQNQNENLVDVNVEKVEDLGNYKLITAKMGSLTIKSKVTRETEIPNQNVKLHIPAEKCCVYEDNKLI